MASAQVNYNDPKNYKLCRKKQYEIWMCKPPVGTIVINKLEQADVVRQLGGKTFFTVDTLEAYASQNSHMYAQLRQLAQQGAIYVTKGQDVVLSGTRGELLVTSIEKVQRTYQVCFNGVWGSDWGRATHERGCGENGQFLLPWMKIRAMGEAAAGTMACFVPAVQRGQIQTSWAVLNFNTPGVEHGLGDFILCAKGADGKPNLGDRWVVNGAVFADTYNNQGWQGCLKTTGVGTSAPEPAPLFTTPADAVSKLGDLVKMFHEEFRNAGKSYKIESKRGQSRDGIDITYRVQAGNDTPLTFTVLFKPNDGACKSVKTSFSSPRWSIDYDFEMNGPSPMKHVAKRVWGILHEDAGLRTVVEWKLMPVTQAMHEAILHNLWSRGFKVEKYGSGRSGTYATMGYEISGHGHTGIELRVRVSLTEQNRARADYKCKYKEEYNDTSRFNISDVQEEAVELVTESLIGAGFPFDM